MTWPNGTRYDTYGSGDPFLPADINGIQDQILQVAGYRGKSIIATEEARSNTAYGLLTTPDEVEGIVLPEDGLIYIAYFAMWKNSVSSNGSAAIFLDDEQLKVASGSSATPVVQEAGGPASTDYGVLGTQAAGLDGQTMSPAYTGHATTGQAICQNGQTAADGGVCVVFAAAGTYDVSIRFKAASGSVTAKERKLWVWTFPFD